MRARPSRTKNLAGTEQGTHGAVCYTITMQTWRNGSANDKEYWPKGSST